jgi:hypothetical protein
MGNHDSYSGLFSRVATGFYALTGAHVSPCEVENSLRRNLWLGAQEILNRAQVQPSPYLMICVVFGSSELAYRGALQSNLIEQKMKYPTKCLTNLPD